MYTIITGYYIDDDNVLHGGEATEGYATLQDAIDDAFSFVEQVENGDEVYVYKGFVGGDLHFLGTVKWKGGRARYVPKEEGNS